MLNVNWINGLKKAGWKLLFISQVDGFQVWGNGKRKYIFTTLGIYVSRYTWKYGLILAGWKFCVKSEEGNIEIWSRSDLRYAFDKQGKYLARFKEKRIRKEELIEAVS